MPRRRLHCGRGTAVLLTCVAAAAAAPVFDRTELGLGTLVQGDTGTARFFFVNSDSDTIVLEEVRAGCNCAVASAGRRVFGPGQRGEIGVELHTWGLQGTQNREVTAVFRRAADSTGAAGLPVKLAVTAFVKCEVMFLPQSINSLHAQPRDTFTARGELVNASGAGVRVLSLRVDTSGGLRVRCAPLPADLGHADRLPFTVMLMPRTEGDTTSRVSGRVVARTTRTRYPLHACAVTIFLR